MAEPELPDRIKRDLEDALREGGVDKLPTRPRRRRRSIKLGFPDPRPRTPAQLVLIGVALFLLGQVLLRPWAGHLTLLGLACVAVALTTYFMRPQGHVQKYWRGRYLDVPDGTWQERLYRLIYRQK
jgi:hypothetical protein